MLGDLAPARLLVVDMHHTLGSIDTEAGHGRPLPSGTNGRAAMSDPVNTLRGRLFTAAAPGTARVLPTAGWAAFMRVMQDKYHGLGRFRHFPREDGDDDE